MKIAHFQVDGYDNMKNNNFSYDIMKIVVQETMVDSLSKSIISRIHY